MDIKMIEIKNIVKRYAMPNNPHQTVHLSPIRSNAVDGISLSIKRNSTTLLKGPNGAGKTTLLSIIGGMTRPTSGRVIIDKKDISSLPENFLSEVRKKYFGFIFQNYQLISGISVIENIMIPAYTSGKNPERLRQRAISLLEKLKIPHLAKQKIEHISGGEQQRVAIARALVNNPSIILADEPTAHLHPDLTVDFIKIISELIQGGKTVIISSHDVKFVNSGITERIIELTDGKVSNDIQMLAN